MTEKKDYPLHVQLGISILEQASVCRRENIALRSILRKQGLSDKAIQSRVRRLLKMPDLDETGAQVVERACKEMVRLALEAEAQEVLAKIDPIGRVQ